MSACPAFRARTGPPAAGGRPAALGGAVLRLRIGQPTNPMGPQCARLAQAFRAGRAGTAPDFHSYRAGCSRRLRAGHKTLLASLLCLAVLLVLHVLHVQPATQRLARTASLRFVSRSKSGGRPPLAFPAFLFPSSSIAPPWALRVWGVGWACAVSAAGAAWGCVAWQRHPKARYIVV